MKYSNSHNFCKKESKDNKLILHLQCLENLDQTKHHLNLRLFMHKNNLTCEDTRLCLKA